MNTFVSLPDDENVVDVGDGRMKASARAEIFDAQNLGKIKAAQMSWVVSGAAFSEERRNKTGREGGRLSYGKLRRFTSSTGVKKRCIKMYIAS